LRHGITTDTAGRDDGGLAGVNTERGLEAACALRILFSA